MEEIFRWPPVHSYTSFAPINERGIEHISCSILRQVQADLAVLKFTSRRRVGASSVILKNGRLDSVWQFSETSPLNSHFVSFGHIFGDTAHEALRPQTTVLSR